jgi:hypothetical protein
MGVDSNEVKAMSGRLSSCSKRLCNPGEVTHAGRVVAEPDVGRGAALSDGSSIGWLQAAPENYPAIAFAQGFRSVVALIRMRAIRLPRQEPFPGAACCQPTELPCCEAAPHPVFGLKSV